jgi:TolA-binding protein
MEKYPMTTAGLEAPLYVARRYRENKMQEKSERVYGAAARRYIAFIATDPRGKKVPVLQYLMITAYANMGEWKEASGTLEKMAEKYPHSEGAPIALYRAALINRDMLKNYDRARADFQKLVDGYPLNKLTKNLKGDIAGLPLNRAQARSAGVEHSSIFERNGERKSSLMSPEMTAKQSEIITYYI